MRERVCKNCGGRQYKIVGQNMVKCQFCGTLYVDEQASKEEEILLVAAYEKLRDCKFEEAVYEFDKILSLYPKSFESYFGKALAKNKIVLYSNKRGLSKKPRFFCDEIPIIFEDEDFKKAVENAPEEIASNYLDIEKRIDRERKAYQEKTEEIKSDVVLYQMSTSVEGGFEKAKLLLQKLEEKNIKTYFLQDLEGKERESETFSALKNSKVFLLIANKKNGYNESEVKNLIDRYRYFISLREKYSKGFIIALDENVIAKNELPQELSFCKNYVDFNVEHFVENAVSNIVNIIEKTPQEIAKIEKRKIEKVSPIKKEYVDVEVITPTELGHYKVENVEADDVIKTKWIFLSLKNGDFDATSQLISNELEKDPNNAEMLFAQLLCERKLRTAGEFFQSLSNFNDREKIDKILQYATKEFAEMFVDNWERLVEKIDGEEYYNTYLLYLAKYDTPNRDHFIECAQEKAIDTLDEELIDKVLKCFKADEVERFVKFYFNLAQKSDKQDYYEKILEIDEGHKQSNIAVLLKHFKTNEDKLTFRDREIVEQYLKFFEENDRDQIVSMIIELILPVAFLDIEQAESQIDFYLSYVDENNVEILKKIAEKFLEMHFFKQAEKYISLAISRSKEDASLYWTLIKTRAHCVNETEIVRTDIDITKFAEWQTLLHYSSDSETERYAEIVSKAHLFQGEKKPITVELYDKTKMIESLNDFILRNNQILIDFEKENGQIARKGCNYFNLQLAPFENYLESLKQTENFDEYVEIVSRIYHRLYFLDLTIDASISSIQVMDKGEGLKNTNLEGKHSKKAENFIKRQEAKKEHKKFWKWFCFAFFEMVPVIFLTILLSLIVADPKAVYTYFSQNFVFVLLIYSVFIGTVNLFLYVIKKKKLGCKTKIPLILLMIFAFANVILISVGFIFTRNEIKVSTASEFSTLLNNASYSTIIVENDIDFEGREVGVGTFFGRLEGNGHALTNLKLKHGESVALFKANYGSISNINISIVNAVYENVKNFSVVVIKNYGEINNCLVNSASVELKTQKSALIGGFSANLCGGKIENCTTELSLKINLAGDEVVVGEIAGRITDNSHLQKNVVNGYVSVENASEAKVYFGGLVGYVENYKNTVITQNQSNVNFTISGQIREIYGGGLIGYGWISTKNNYAVGEFAITGAVNRGYVGGLYGVYKNHAREEYIEFSYSKITCTDIENLQIRGLVGGECGSVRKCYTNNDYELMGSETVGTYGCDETCKNNVNGYEVEFGFDSEIWNGVDETSENFPTLK